MIPTTNLIPRLPVPILATAIGMLGLSAHGAVLFSDDFESYTAGNNIGTSVWTEAAGVSTYMTARDESTSTTFGTPNQYAQLADVGGGSNQFLRLLSSTEIDAANALTTLSFDFYEPTGGGDSVMRFGYAGNDGTRYDLNGGGGRLVSTLNNGTIGGVSGGSNTYSLDTAYSMYMIFNDTNASVSYAGGSIAAFTAALWLEELGTGSFVFAGSASASNSQDLGGYRIGFRTFNAEVQTLLVDNVSLFEGAPSAIPEPTTTLLGALGMLALLRRRRA